MGYKINTNEVTFRNIVIDLLLDNLFQSHLLARRAIGREIRRMAKRTPIGVLQKADQSSKNRYKYPKNNQFKINVLTNPAYSQFLKINHRQIKMVAVKRSIRMSGRMNQEIGTWEAF